MEEDNTNIHMQILEHLFKICTLLYKKKAISRTETPVIWKLGGGGVKKPYRCNDAFNQRQTQGIKTTSTR